MTDRYECIFCQTKCGSLDQLKEHSGECQKHPLMEMVGQLQEEVKELEHELRCMDRYYYESGIE